MEHARQLDALNVLLGQPQQGGEALKALIAGRVPEQIVDALEVVQVGDQQRAGAATATRALEFQVEDVLEPAAVQQGCQRVRTRGIRQAADQDVHAPAQNRD